MGFEPNTRIFSRVLNPKKFKCTSKRLSLFHMKEAPFYALNFKPGYLEHRNSDFRSKKCVMKLRIRDTSWNYKSLKISIFLCHCFLLIQERKNIVDQILVNNWLPLWDSDPLWVAENTRISRPTTFSIELWSHLQNEFL